MVERDNEKKNRETFLEKEVDGRAKRDNERHRVW